MKYVCPGCDQEMLTVNGSSYLSLGWEPDVQCIGCQIIYVTPFKIDDISGMRVGVLEYLKGEEIAKGSFEQCCRVYKLKAFS